MQTNSKFAVNRQAALTLLAAVLFAVGGVLSAWESYWLDQRGVVATAMVLDERPSGKRLTQIDVRFVTASGQTVETHTEHYISAEVGREIEVVYDPKKPERLRAANWDIDYQMTAVWFGASFVFAVFGMLYVLGLGGWLRELMTRR